VKNRRIGTGIVRSERHRVSGPIDIPAWLVAIDIDRQLQVPALIVLVAVIAWLYGLRGNDPRFGRRALVEALLVAAGFYAYKRGRILIVGDLDVALKNSQRVLELERRLHLTVEQPLQRFVLDHDTLLRFFNAWYSWSFLPFIFGTLIWLFLRDDATLRLTLTTLGVSIVLALITIALFPVAPPRLLPESGLVDTHALLGRPQSFTNEYAAVPSLHVGWTALCGYALFRSLRGGIRWFWVLVPVALMATTVMVTGNHYWVDGVVGAAFTLVPAAVLVFAPRLADDAPRHGALDRLTVKRRPARPL
jgi:hypothetical protein